MQRVSASLGLENSLFPHPVMNDIFQLFDLKVEVVCPPSGKIICGAKQGDYFTLQGEMLHLPSGQGISIYSLGKVVPVYSHCNLIRTNTRSSCAAAVLPLLAAKQRVTHACDWMSTDALVACPDPNCPSQLRILRTGVRSFKHSDTTVVGLEGN